MTVRTAPAPRTELDVDGRKMPLVSSPVRVGLESVGIEHREEISERADVICAHLGVSCLAKQPRYEQTFGAKLVASDYGHKKLSSLLEELMRRGAVRTYTAARGKQLLVGEVAASASASASAAAAATAAATAAAAAATATATATAVSAAGTKVASPMKSPKKKKKKK